MADLGSFAFCSELVAADFARRLPCSHDLSAGKLWQRAGQQHLLNLARSLEFYFLRIGNFGEHIDFPTAANTRLSTSESDQKLFNLPDGFSVMDQRVGKAAK